MKTMLRRLSRATLAFACFAATPLAASAPPATPTAPDVPALKSPAAEGEATAWIKTEENARRDFRLAVAARRYAPIEGDGPTIALYGAVHIADARFYETLQSSLQAYDVVLFEGVNGGKAIEAPAEAAASMLAGDPEEDAPEQERPVGIQKRLAETFGLSFQLEEMDAGQSNWRNSDMSMDEVMSRLRAKDIEPGVFFSMMDGSSAIAEVASAMLQIIERVPFAAVRMKVLMMETLASADELMMSNPVMGEGMLEVIIEDRNEVVVDDLRALLAQEGDERPASIAVLYGAGHLDHLAERVESEFGYAVEATRWITAIKVNLDEAGISKSEMRMWRLSLQQQLAMARAQAAAAEGDADEQQAPDDE